MASRIQGEEVSQRLRRLWTSFMRCTSLENAPVSKSDQFPILALQLNSLVVTYHNCKTIFRCYFLFNVHILSDPKIGNELFWQS